MSRIVFVASEEIGEQSRSPGRNQEKSSMLQRSRMRKKDLYGVVQCYLKKVWITWMAR
jgi:hypothetical protein